MSEHPFLNQPFEIRWSQLTADHIIPDVEDALDTARREIEAIANQTGPLSYTSTVDALDTALEPLNTAWSLISHLDSVCNSDALRTAYNTMLPKVSDFYANVHLNEALWKTLKRYESDGDRQSLSPTKQRYFEETVTDFREAGADLPETSRKRVAAIQNKLSELTQKYSENCLDAVKDWEHLIHDEDELAGLPDAAKAAAKESAKEKNKEGWRFTLQAPSYLPVSMYAESDDLRRTLWEGYSEIGRQTAHDNRPLVPQIIRLRHELATLIGEKNFADYVTKRRMAQCGQKALDFGEELFAKVCEPMQQAAQSIREFKAKETGAEVELLEPWEVAYWSERFRKANYEFDEEALRPYFPIKQVITGMFDIAEKLFGLKIKERASSVEATDTSAVEVWADDVQFYELFDASTDEHLGSFYADWHPRENKRGGAWMNYLRTGNRDSEKGPRTAHLGLICGNLTKAVGDTPALLTHREVETIFHEFGHLLHHLCGEVEVKALNGVNVPWDFVELPSQILENWCWDRESLDLFARHHETDEPIPDALFEKMVAARNFLRAIATTRQLGFGKMDLELHINWAKMDDQDPEGFIKEALADYQIEYKTQPKTNLYNFGHLFSGVVGYASGYYSYKWAEVLDADAFTKFKESGILNSDTGKAFRSKILAKGNSAEPAALYRDFMGRDPNPDALLARDGLCASS